MQSGAFEGSRALWASSWRSSVVLVRAQPDAGNAGPLDRLDRSRLSRRGAPDATSRRRGRDRRAPASGPRDLEVVASDRLAPPGLLDPPAIADLDGLAPAVPADRDERAGGIQLHLDRRVAAQEAGHRGTPRSPETTGRHAQRVSGSGASGSVMATRRTRSSPNVRASLASCHSSRAPRAACGVNSGSC